MLLLMATIIYYDIWVTELGQHTSDKSKIVLTTDTNVNLILFHLSA